MKRDAAKARRAAGRPDRPGANCKAEPGAFVPKVDPRSCEGKADCVAVCPYDVFEIGHLSDEHFRAMPPLEVASTEGDVVAVGEAEASVRQAMSRCAEHARLADAGLASQNSVAALVARGDEALDRGGARRGNHSSASANSLAKDAPRAVPLEERTPA